METLRFIARHARFLGFGFLLYFASSFGQTFFISLFNESLRETLGWGHSALSGLYSGATLLSAVTLSWLGGRIDEAPLRRFAVAVAFGLAGAALVMSAAQQAALVFLAFYGLRLCGQGLMTHTAATAMGRRFAAERGRALALVSLGLPAGEALLPWLATTMLLSHSRGAIWALMGLGIAVTLAPLILGALVANPDAEARAERPVLREGEVEARSWTRGEVLRDVGFYLALPAILALPFTMTGLFFHQQWLFQAAGWDKGLIAQGFQVYAGTTVVASLVVGFAIDALGARRLLPWVVAPLVLALLTLVAGGPGWTALIYMGLAGFGAGGAGTIIGAYWPEVYGVGHLGSIRAVASAVMVLSTSAAPILFGLAIDGGVGPRGLALVGVVGGLVAMALAFGAARRAA